MDLIGTYPLNLYALGDTQKCGIGILIVNEEFPNPKDFREGAEREVDYLQKLMEDEFSLELHTYKNLKHWEMNQLFLSLSGKGHQGTKYPRVENKHSILVIAISSHGANDGIFTSNSKLMKFHKIRGYFSPKKCQSLIGKPKLFLINCCRTFPGCSERKEMAFLHSNHQSIVRDGIDSDPNSEEEIDGNEDEQPPKEITPYEVASEGSDFITVNFCVRGMASLRGTVCGSLAIKEFYIAYRAHGHDLHFQDFLTLYTNKVKLKIYEIMLANKKERVTQCPEITTTLDKHLYFPRKSIKNEIPIKNLFISPTGIGTANSAWEGRTMSEEENLPETGPGDISDRPSAAPQGASESEENPMMSCEFFEDGIKRSRIRHQQASKKYKYRFHPYRATKCSRSDVGIVLRPHQSIVEPQEDVTGCIASQSHQDL